MDNSRVFKMVFAEVYALFIRKAEKKGRSKDETDTIICWPTGYSKEELKRQIKTECDIETFFSGAPRMNPYVCRITGVICG